MRDFTLDEAIKQHEAIAAEQRELYGLCPCPCDGLTDCKCLESGKDKGCMKLHYEHQQLADWLTDYKKLRSLVDACNILAVDAFAVEKLCKDLKEAKRLLKSAIHEWNFICEWGDCGEHCCWFQNGKCTQEWSHKAEALKLIGDENDAE